MQGSGIRLQWQKKNPKFKMIKPFQSPQLISCKKKKKKKSLMPDVTLTFFSQNQDT